jgi:hypothetical protein
MVEVLGEGRRMSVTKEEMLATLATLLRVYVESGQEIPELERDLKNGAAQAIRCLIENGPEVDDEWIEKWLDKNMACNCHEAFISRKMYDPNCFRHGYIADVDWRSALREAGVRIRGDK